MKRRSSSESFNGSNNSIAFHGDAYNGGVDDGWCSMIGCGGIHGYERPDDSRLYERPDAITSVTPKHDASTTDFSLSQTSDANSTGRRRDSKTRPAKRKYDDNKESGDHTNLSSLIASELSKLSLEDREKALEEVHGVIETNNEDPEEINELLDQVKDELKRIRYKQAYEKAAFLSYAYVTDPELVVFFLRADNYDARKAAIRLVEHFKYKLKIFGEHTLVRDIMYDDLSEAAKSVLKSGFILVLPTPDRSGRRVVACNLSELLKTGTLADVVRVFLSTMKNTVYFCCLSVVLFIRRSTLLTKDYPLYLVLPVFLFGDHFTEPSCMVSFGKKQSNISQYVETGHRDGIFHAWDVQCL